MLNSLITSKTRKKLLLKFFLNGTTKSYLRNLEHEFCESSNAIRIELNRLEEGGLLISELTGNRKYYCANVNHPLFSDINNILKKIVGIDQIIDHVASKIGDLESAFIAGDLAKGRESKIIDLVLVGNTLDNNYIETLATKAEKFISRKIRHIEVTQQQLTEFFANKPLLLIWKTDKF